MGLVVGSQGGAEMGGQGFLTLQDGVGVGDLLVFGVGGGCGVCFVVDWGNRLGGHVLYKGIQ